MLIPNWVSNHGANEWDENNADHFGYAMHICAEISYFLLSAVAIEFTRTLPLAASYYKAYS